MQPIFELKNKLPFDSKIFEKMRKTAVDLLQNTETVKYTQVVVLFSLKGNEYSAVIKNALSDEITEETSLLERIRSAEDTEIGYVLCMWQDNGIDIASMKFRKALCDLDSKNKESLLFVMTKEGVSVTPIASTIK